jgi:hypothetical protein
VRIPPAARHACAAAGLAFREGVHGAAHALLNVLPRFMMCNPGDVGGCVGVGRGRCAQQGGGSLEGVAGSHARGRHMSGAGSLHVPCNRAAWAARLSGRALPLTPLPTTIPYR